MAPAPSRCLLIALVLSLGALGLRELGSQGESKSAATGAVRAALPAAGPRAAEVDRFHPDLQPDAAGKRPPQPEPALGGSVTLQIPSMPRVLCGALDNSSSAAQILFAVHDRLLELDPETWEMNPALAKRRVIEDQLVLTDEGVRRHPNARALQRPQPDARGEREHVAVLYGELADAGDSWRLTPRSPDNPTREPLEVAKSDVREVVRGGAITFELRQDVLWQPSEGFPEHRFDAGDVLFSWRIYSNPQIDCDDRRYQFQKVAEAEQLGPFALRFFLVRPDAWAADDLAEMCLLPAHLYDLSDPDNPDHDAAASQEKAARYVNENPHNRAWIGLGPWRVTSFESDVIEAKRFERYYDPARTGYFDRIRWRSFADDAAALQALLAGELDFFDRLSADDYLGGQSELEAFRSRCYKALGQGGRFAYVCWNMHNPALADVRVRQAFAHCIDVQHDVLDGYYRGLGNVVSGPFPFHSLAYDHSVEPIGFDLDRARALLAEAGWYDRDGDGWADRDGKPLQLTYTAIATSAFSKRVGLVLKESLKQVGVDLEMNEFDFPTLQQRSNERALDCFSLAWLPPLEPDPEQLWHSRWGKEGVKSQNLSGLEDAQVDALIERGQREFDTQARMEVWHQLHRRLAELAPYLWLVNPATKIAVQKRLFGVQLFHVEPGYEVRRWYLRAGTEGTRPAGGLGYWASR
jgi:peptide/nickel transport system substrate-binding protein